MIGVSTGKMGSVGRLRNAIIMRNHEYFVNRSVAANVKNRMILDISYQLILKNYHFRQYLFWCAARLDNEELLTIVTSSFSIIPRYFLHSMYIGDS